MMNTTTMKSMSLQNSARSSLAQKREPAFVRRYRAIAAGALCPRCGYAIVAREGLDAGARAVRHCPECGFPTRLMRRLGEPYRGNAIGHDSPLVGSGLLRFFAGLLAGCCLAVPVIVIMMLIVATEAIGGILLLSVAMAISLLIFIIAALVFFSGDRVDRAVCAKDQLRGGWWVVIFIVSVIAAVASLFAGIGHDINTSKGGPPQISWGWHAFIPTLAAAAGSLLMIAAMLARRTAAISLRLDDPGLLRRAVRLHACVRVMLIGVLIGGAGAWVAYALGWDLSLFAGLIGAACVVIVVGFGVMWMLRPLRRHEALLRVS